MNEPVVKEPLQEPLTCKAKNKDRTKCKRQVATGQQFCWQHASGWKAKRRSLTRSQTTGFILQISGVLIALILGIPPLWRMLFPPHPIVEVRADSNMGLGKIPLSPSSTTDLGFDRRDDMPMEMMFYVYNTGDEAIIKPVYAALG